ncbi:MAG: hypothetical protein K6E17_07705 [Clostridiales bacterium]|nr:hypothetical protein [Clostridiales bacterium]
MMEMPIRIKRRLQDAAINWRERMDGVDDERQQHANIHRQRMTCSESFRGFQQSQDWVEGVAVSPSGRFRVIEEKKPKQKIISAQGIRWDAGWIAVIVIAVICAAILLADVAGIGTTSRNLTKLDSKITAITERNEQLKSELNIQDADISVCTEAVKLNLISSRAVQTIILTAPTEANLTMMTAQAAPAGAMTE